MRIYLIQFSILCTLFTSCQQGTLTHNRVIQNNTAGDTIIVINPDFDNAIDTIFPGDTALIYRYEVLDTKQVSEPCKWLGDTLIIKNLDGTPLLRSVKTESFWTYSLVGDQNRVQTCTFIISTGDF